MDKEIMLQKENAELKLEIAYLKRKLCGESAGHKFKFCKSELGEEYLKYEKQEDGVIFAKPWRDITDVYICEKCGEVDYRRR